MIDTTFARQLIQKPGEATTNALFAGGHREIVWIDWREADDHIVQMVAAAIGTEFTTGWQGTRLQIGYRGKTIDVALNGRPGEQDLTLAGLNRALIGQFEIRYVAASEGGDTLAFMVLPVAEWLALANEYGDALRAALPKLDLQRPLFGDEAVSKEAVRAQIEQANPGMLGALKLGRAAFRLITTGHAAGLREQHAQSPDTLPVVRPFCGDLALGYFNDMRDSSEAITEGELHRCNLDDEQLRALAWRHCSDAWGRFNLSHQHGIGRFHGNERIDNSSFALCAAYWDHQNQETGPLVAAFPRRELALFARADDADGIAFLIDAIDAVDREQPAALSTQLFVRVDGAWQVRPWRDDERRPQPLALAAAAARADYKTQYEWAYLYQSCAMASKAAPIYRRAGEQAERERVYSPDMFVNGSALLCNLADLYEHGNGVARDYAEAHALYRRSASMDNFVAEYSLGNLYLNGLGVARDIEKAKYWLQRSAAQGYAAARNGLREIDRSATKR